MSGNHEYEDDYYETSDFEMVHYDEDVDPETHSSSSSRPEQPNHKRKSLKKKRRLEDWLEEKRLRNELQDE